MSSEPSLRSPSFAPIAGATRGLVMDAAQPVSAALLFAPFRFTFAHAARTAEALSPRFF